jgi:hypothetical protein
LSEAALENAQKLAELNYAASKRTGKYTRRHSTSVDCKRSKASY